MNANIVYVTGLPQKTIDNLSKRNTLEEILNAQKELGIEPNITPLAWISTGPLKPADFKVVEALERTTQYKRLHERATEKNKKILLNAFKCSRNYYGEGATGLKEHAFFGKRMKSLPQSEAFGDFLKRVKGTSDAFVGALGETLEEIFKEINPESKRFYQIYECTVESPTGEKRTEHYIHENDNWKLKRALKAKLLGRLNLSPIATCYAYGKDFRTAIFVNGRSQGE